MPYSRQQFETAYAAIVQMLHGLRYVETEEVIRWVKQLTSGNGAASPNEEGGVTRLLAILQNVHDLRESMKVHGIPPIPKYESPTQSRVVPGPPGHG